MAMVRLSRRCYEQLAGWGAVLGVVVALVGCGAPEGSTRAVPESSVLAVPESSMRSVPVAILDAGARPVATTAASPVVTPIVTPVVPEVEPSPFELVGTSISATDAFAFLKEADQRVLTVHEGDRIDGYTIAAIAPDRVKVRSPDNDEHLLMLLAPTGNAAARTTGAAPEPLANTTLITEGINTDQTIPNDVTFGPTASLPEGASPRGH